MEAMRELGKVKHSHIINLKAFLNIKLGKEPAPHRYF